jgi:hypothetical protein
LVDQYKKCLEKKGIVLIIVPSAFCLHFVFNFKKSLIFNCPIICGILCFYFSKIKILSWW